MTTIIKHYEEYLIKNKENIEECMKNFINMREDNGFSAMHCAAF